MEGKQWSSMDSKETSNKLCALCLCETPSHMMHTIKSCGCQFCVHCLQTYLTLNIRENNINRLVCPESRCPARKKGKRLCLFLRSSKNAKFNLPGGKFSPQEIRLLVSDETYSLYKKYRLIKQVDEDPYQTWCPKANCDNICVITKPSVGRLPSSAALSIKLTKSAKVSLIDGRSSFYCSKCDETYCTLCRNLWHDLPMCKSTSEAELLMVGDNSDPSNVTSNIKKCPRCAVWIERDDGCAQMMCRKCKHVFCWFCLQSLEDDFLLRHFDKGPCKNKLGHSRPSVLWHRTQVIAIFAGFGMLLLLASPLFLLASPCLLCCNCCCGSNFKYMGEKENKDEEDGFTVFHP